MRAEWVDPRRSFVVAIHDVAPIHRARVEILRDALATRVEGKLVGAVVPCWHGVPLEAGDFGLIRGFGEVLQHGFSHRQDRFGPVSYLSGRSNELDGLPLAEIRDRLARGREVLRRTFGVEVAGFVPPAWRMGRATMADLAGLGFRQVVGFGSIQAVGSPSIPLATWSWDWGIIPTLGRAGERVGDIAHRLRPGALPCVVAHPVDVDRGYLPRIVRVVDRLLLEGRSPVTFAESGAFATAGGLA